jgi:uncharacterized cupredoxin-like copper-binding protein
VNLRARWWLAVSMVVVLGLVAASCGDDDGGSADGGTADNTVSATLADFTITLDQSTAPAGDVTFEVTNDAEQVHEFVVFQTDLAADALPTDADGNVDESGEGVTLIDEIEDIEGGSTQSLDVSLDAGGYVVICNLPGHYAQGMHASLTVE